MSQEKPLRIRQASRTVHIVGRKTLVNDERVRFFGDFYYRAMAVSWPTFFAGAAAVFLTLNVSFALVYAFGEFILGQAPVANTRPGNLLDLFFFSVETLATVGFGDMHPQSSYGHGVTTVEIFTGMSFLAVMTGLIFNRFSRPRARLVFAHSPVVNIHEGLPTLMIRVANARTNMISDASAQLWLIRSEQSAEAETFRRFHKLKLVRDENPIFILSWTVFHAIDDSSPLFGQTPDDLIASNASFVLVLSGIDENAVQELRARQTYDAQAIQWGCRYADIITSDNQGHVHLDYAKFHEVQKITTPPQPR